MVVSYLHGVSIAAFPHKAHAELVVYPYWVLPRTLAFESLQAIARRDAQILEAHRSVYHRQLAQCPSLDIRWDRPRMLAVPQPLGVLVGEALYHRKDMLTRRVINGKR